MQTLQQNMLAEQSQTRHDVHNTVGPTLNGAVVIGKPTNPPLTPLDTKINQQILLAYKNYNVWKCNYQW